MYLSIDNDWNFYGYDRFENDIRNIITHIEKYLSNNELINFMSGEFTGI